MNKAEALKKRGFYSKLVRLKGVEWRSLLMHIVIVSIPNWFD